MVLSLYNQCPVCFHNCLDFKQVLLAEFGGMPVPASVKRECLARSANRARQFSRRWDATDHSFKMREDDIPNGFLKEEIVKHGRRHLIFATEEQLRLLRKARSWYIDLTFKFCQLPFKQLLTISTFVSAEDDAKQLPLVFALMSGDAKKDYRKVNMLNKALLYYCVHACS